MLGEDLCKDAVQFPHVARVNVVEDWSDHLTPGLFSLQDLEELLQAPGGGSEVPREDNDGDPGALDGLLERGRDPLSSAELDVVNEGVYAVQSKRVVEVAYEVLARVLAPETEKHVVVPPRDHHSR